MNTYTRYDLTQFGARLRRGRLDKNLTQRKLAQIVGIDQHYISDYEIKGRKPTLLHLCLIASVLGLPVGYLLGGKYYE
ncbi:MAG: helix-turn-helix domain-containing protein [Ruminococcus sp.]|nr:helix-turn-helix domain-containing protein [Ruminococcus sp.]